MFILTNINSNTQPPKENEKKNKAKSLKSMAKFERKLLVANKPHKNKLQ